MSAESPEIPPVTYTEGRCTAPPKGQYLSRCFVVGRLFHSQRATGLAGKELAHELVVGVEEFRRGSGLNDPALPEHCDVVRDAARGHDVVRDDDVAAPVLRVHFLDQFAEKGGAERVETRVRIVEENDLRVAHERTCEAGALAHTARELVRHLVAGAAEADFAQAAVADLGDLVL